VGDGQRQAQRKLDAGEPSHVGAQPEEELECQEASEPERRAHELWLRPMSPQHPANQGGNDDEEENGKLTYDYAMLNGFVCLACHKGRFDVPNPVKTTRYVKKAHFPHDTHVVHGKCMDCHANLLQFPERSPENLPSVNDCMRCHERANGNAGCVKCHKFHLPPPPPELVKNEGDE